MRVNDSSDIFLIGKYQRFVNIRKEIVYAVFRIENRGVPATVIKVTVCSARSITAYLCGNDRYRQRNSRYRTEAVGLVPEPYNAERRKERCRILYYAQPEAFESAVCDLPQISCKLLP